MAPAGERGAREGERGEAHAVREVPRAVPPREVGDDEGLEALEEPEVEGEAVGSRVRAVGPRRELEGREEERRREREAEREARRERPAVAQERRPPGAATERRHAREREHDAEEQGDHAVPGEDRESDRDREEESGPGGSRGGAPPVEGDDPGDVGRRSEHRVPAGELGHESLRGEADHDRPGERGERSVAFAAQERVHAEREDERVEEEVEVLGVRELERRVEEHGWVEEPLVRGEPRGEAVEDRRPPERDLAVASETARVILGAREAVAHEIRGSRERERGPRGDRADGGQGDDGRERRDGDQVGSPLHARSSVARDLYTRPGAGPGGTWVGRA